MDSVRIATRKSPLALWQAEHVAARLREAHPRLQVELVPMSTRGDRILDVALGEMGGKGLFVKELELALLDRRADIAAHSVKDVPAELPEALHMPVFLARADARDAFVSNGCATLDALAPGARVGTGSLRRKCQLRRWLPALEYVDIRGNVGTRLGRLDAGELDAVILASAGLKRLGLESRIRQIIPAERVLPAVGQGAIGIECRRGDERVQGLIAALQDPDTVCCVSAERTMNAVLGGSCHTPVAGHAVLEAGGRLHLRGLVGSLDGTEVVEAHGEGGADEVDALGRGVAASLLAQGGGGILESLRIDA